MIFVVTVTSSYRTIRFEFNSGRDALDFLSALARHYAGPEDEATWAMTIEKKQEDA